ncbi:MAG: hypothetical protein QM582_09210, partial [Micropruina sp.]
TAEPPPPAAPQPPLTLVRPAGSRAPGSVPRAGDGVSFASMFAGFADQYPALETGADSVQRQTVDQAPPSSEPEPAESVPAGPGSAEATSTSAAVVVAGATSGGNVDELARRLYEPLAARLREELWLDRERAGWLTEMTGG